MNGQPYLEVHHIVELSNNRSDSPINVIALCPNCHRRVTHGKDGLQYNNELKIKKLESSMDE
ncbi:MAG: HNH endonuclease [Vicingus serpentipes]|nr:HNH endonuclease [Vicingus serpentipes]